MDDQFLPPSRTYSSAWSIPMMCLGMCIIAACVLIPQSESNKKLAAERDKLKHDLTYVETQLSVNDEFLKNVGGDAGLAERLAQRQMKVIRQGSSVLELKHQPAREEMSPFQLVSVAPPVAPPSITRPLECWAACAATPATSSMSAAWA